MFSADLAKRHPAEIIVEQRVLVYGIAPELHMRPEHAILIESEADARAERDYAFDAAP